MVEAVPEDQADGGFEMHDDMGNEARGTMMIKDASVFAAKNDEADIFTDQKAIEFSVRDPSDFNGHIVYTVKGTDL